MEAQSSSKMWPSEKWMGFIVYWGITLVVIAIIYTVLHSRIDGSKVSQLSKDEIATTTLILNDTTVADSLRKESALRFMIDRLMPEDTLEEKRFRNEVLNLKIPTLIASLPAITVSSECFFWLNSDMKYLEVIFWTIFGVFANLLYKSSEAVAQGIFRHKEDIPYYVAKIYYAPLISLVIFFSYSILTKSNEVHFDNSSYELLVFSFIMGFFSSRAIELLNKLKDALLPGGKGEEDVDKVTLTGKIEPPTATPAIDLENINVKLVSPADGSIQMSTTTDKGGVYTFKNAKPGVYSIVAEKTEEGVGTFKASVDNRKVTKEKKVDVENLILTKQP